MMDATGVRTYMQRPGGGRALGLCVAGVEVLLTPPDEATQAEAERLASTLLAQETEYRALVTRAVSAESEVRL